MKVVEAKQIKKDYQLGKTIVHALKGVDLVIEKGEFLSVAGPSGSGKTTLLNIVGCLDTATAGDIYLNEKKVEAMTPDQQCEVRRFNIGFIFQSYNLIPVLTAGENISFVLSLLKKYSDEEIRERTQKMLDLVGIGEYYNHRPNEMSGGQQQRVAIARALIKEPALVLADEPTANLDSNTGSEILDVMKRLNEDLKVTFVFSTHDQMVMDRAERLVILKDGLIDKDERRS